MSNAKTLSRGSRGETELKSCRKGWPGRLPGVAVCLVLLLLLAVGSSIAGDKGEVTTTADKPEAAVQLPSMEEFTPMEEVPAMIEMVEPKYPKAEEEAGIEGIVWIKALVGRTGAVLGVVVFKSSGHEALDASAIKAAVNNRYRPGIQNGHPVAAWISYKVTFAIPEESEK